MLSRIVAMRHRWQLSPCSVASVTGGPSSFIWIASDSGVIVQHGCRVSECETGDVALLIPVPSLPLAFPHGVVFQAKK